MLSPFESFFANPALQGQFGTPAGAPPNAQLTNATRALTLGLRPKRNSLHCRNSFRPPSRS